MPMKNPIIAKLTRATTVYSLLVGGYLLIDYEQKDSSDILKLGF